MFGLPIIAVIAFITAFTVSLITTSVHIRQSSGKSFDGDITFPDKRVDDEDIQEIDTHICDQISESSYIICRMGEGVAERIGVKRTHYIEFETGNVDYYPKEILDKLARLYQILVEDLLDEYNQFLYKGQGRGILKKALKYHENVVRIINENVV